MIFNLPVLKEQYDIQTKQVDSRESMIECDLNFSIDAQQTWEDNFPEQAKQIGLFDFVEKMKDVKIVDQATAGIALKIIYCFSLFDRKMTFREFVRLFTFNNLEYTKKLCDILAEVISFINERNQSKKNN